MSRELLVVLLSIAFRLTLVAQNERLILNFPTENKWKIIQNIQDSTSSKIIYIPENESEANWNTLVLITKAQFYKNHSMIEVANSFIKGAMDESPNAKATFLGKSGKNEKKWILLKTETPNFPNDPNPESDLFYVKEGTNWDFVICVMIKKKKFPKLIDDKWVKILKLTKIDNI